MNQKVLLTPGPLSTSKGVKEAMLYDLGTRDQEYQDIVKHVEDQLLDLAHGNDQVYACILLQGSGTYGVESVLTSVVKENEKVLILSNGAYGVRMAQICEKAHVPYVKVDFAMTAALPVEELEGYISQSDITHVAYIHSETTAGVLNDIKAIQGLIKKYHKLSIVDAMSSFGGVDIALDELDVDYLITSSNKCLHGVPGVAIVFAKIQHLLQCQGVCHSLSLDLYEQYMFAKQQPGSFRFTSPTHVILALQKAIEELKQSGGIPARTKRYQFLQKEIKDCMLSHGFEILVDEADQSCIITTYLVPSWLDFHAFYQYFKAHDFLLYSGKLPGIDAFRIGNIGNIQDEDLRRFKEVLHLFKETSDES